LSFQSSQARSGRSLKVVAVVPDVSGGSGRSREGVAVVTDVPGGS